MDANPDTEVPTTQTAPGWGVCSLCAVETPTSTLFALDGGVQLCDTCLGLSPESAAGAGHITYDHEGVGWYCTECGLTYTGQHIPQTLAGLPRPFVGAALAHWHTFGLPTDEMRANMEWASPDLIELDCEPAPTRPDGLPDGTGVCGLCSSIVPADELHFRWGLDVCDVCLGTSPKVTKDRGLVRDPFPGATFWTCKECGLHYWIELDGWAKPTVPEAMLARAVAHHHLTDDDIPDTMLWAWDCLMPDGQNFPKTAPEDWRRAWTEYQEEDDGAAA